MNNKPDTNKQRDRLRFRSWHRGTREMDLLLGRFADAHLPAFSPEQLTQYEAILETSDPDLYNWIAGKEPVPAENESEVMRLLCSHCFVEKPDVGAT
jgi:antitoxin CptB